MHKKFAVQQCHPEQDGTVACFDCKLNVAIMQTTRNFLWKFGDCMVENERHQWYDCK
jgi:hypothetical protein